MKKAFLFAALTLCLQAQTNETLGVFHWKGLSGSTYFGRYNPSFVYLNTGSARAEFSLPRVDNPYASQNLTLSGVGMPLLTAITGSTSAQNINVPTTTGVTVQILIDAGTSLQEAVSVSTVDATHLNGIVRYSHSVGALVNCIFSTYSKFVDAEAIVPISGWSVSQMTNFNFIETTGLPPNAFAQYVLTGSSGGGPDGCAYTEDQEIPWVSTATATFLMVPLYSGGSVSITGNPTNGLSITAGPITASQGLGAPCVQVQFLFTTSPEPDVSGARFAYWWDRS